MSRDQLLHSSVYRRARRGIVGAARRADEFISRLGRADVRVLFEAATPLSLAVFKPVLDRLRLDARFEFWFTSADGVWGAEEIFEAAGITERVVTSAAARWMKFDAYVNTDFWNMTWLNRPAKRIHLFHGVAGKYGLDAPLELAPVIASFDRILYPNRDRLRRYAQAGLVDAERSQAALVGYPKVDCLVDGSLERSVLQESFGLNPELPTVLYAPTWSGESSLNAVGPRLFEVLADLGVNVIVKLHDRSYEPTERGSGGMAWRARLREIGASLPLHVAQLTDASPYMFVSDLLITDHSSVGFEFMLLDRPVIVIDCPRLIGAAHINIEKVRLLGSAATTISAADELPGAVTRALEEPAALSARRREVAGELFHCPGCATTRAVQSIYDVLGLSAPPPAHGTKSPIPADPFPPSTGSLVN